MSLRVAMTLFMDGVEVQRLPVSAGYDTFNSDEQIVEKAIEELFHAAAFLVKNRPAAALPEFNLLRIHLPDGTDVDIDGDQFVNVLIWDSLIKRGVDPAAMVADAKHHRDALNGAEETAEIKIAKVITEKYILVTSVVHKVPADA